jgi:translation initiation factor IF-3
MEALRMAGELDVDLVEIAATANPPVCRLMDYGKFKYQEQKKAAEAKAKQTVIEIKEVKFRPGTDDGDYNIKMRNMRASWPRRRQVQDHAALSGPRDHAPGNRHGAAEPHPRRTGRLIMVEQFPKLEGRQMIMMIAPGRKKPGALPNRPRKLLPAAG